MKKSKEGIKVRGFYRLTITEDKDSRPIMVGDSGWIENTVVNDGFNNFLAKSLGGISGSSQITYAALGSGSATPAAADTALSGESILSKRASVIAASSSNSKAVQFTAVFDSGASFVTATKTINDIALFATSAITAGTMFCANTYSSSSVATNQNVNVCYTINFS